MISRRHTAILVILGLSASITAYLSLGGHQAVRQHLAMQQQVQRLKQDPAQLKQLTVQLAQRLQSGQDDPQGWYLLGKLYLHQGEFSLAANCFRQAYQLDPSIKALADWVRYAEDLVAQNPSSD